MSDPQADVHELLVKLQNKQYFNMILRKATAFDWIVENGRCWSLQEVEAEMAKKENA